MWRGTDGAGLAVAWQCLGRAQREQRAAGDQRAAATDHVHLHHHRAQAQVGHSDTRWKGQGLWTRVWPLSVLALLMRFVYARHVSSQHDTGCVANSGDGQGPRGRVGDTQ